MIPSRPASLDVWLPRLAVGLLAMAFITGGGSMDRGWGDVATIIPWQHYMAYTVQGGSRTFTDLLKNAGLESPFDEACLRGVCAEAEKALADFDLTGIE